MTRKEVRELLAGDDWYANYGQSVVDLLVSDPNETFTLSKIIERTGYSREIALEVLHKLVMIDMVMNANHTGSGLTIYEPSDAALRSVRDKRYQPRIRPCLVCSEKFLSTHAGNRLCFKCQSDDDEAMAA